jgi:hypothetical protein
VWGLSGWCQGLGKGFGRDSCPPPPSPPLSLCGRETGGSRSRSGVRADLMVSLGAAVEGLGFRGSCPRSALRRSSSRHYDQTQPPAQTNTASSTKTQPPLQPNTASSTNKHSLNYENTKKHSLPYTKTQPSHPTSAAGGAVAIAEVGGLIHVQPDPVEVDESMERSKLLLPVARRVWVQEIWEVDVARPDAAGRGGV